mmetsp:Transcript_126293/g.269421  ORF Transcript_126293/g.269421 Transcript_126293/m.269421 type:complete len:153 (+) Transcript_126293:99-557(+)
MLVTAHAQCDAGDDDADTFTDRGAFRPVKFETLDSLDYDFFDYECASLDSGLDDATGRTAFRPILLESMDSLDLTPLDWQEDSLLTEFPGPPNHMTHAGHARPVARMHIMESRSETETTSFRTSTRSSEDDGSSEVSSGSYESVTTIYSAHR